MSSYLLHIDTATTMCSVAISKDEQLIFCEELNEGFTHAENLHIFIIKVLAAANITPTDLNAVVVSKGPGSYTGLRIGVSTAKGLAYALNIPLISINTLQLMTVAAVNQINEDAHYCPMIDARRMEVYTATFSNTLQELQPTEAGIIEESSIHKYNNSVKTFFFGDGMPKCRALLQNNTNAFFIENILPSARHMIIPAYHKFISKEFEDIAYFEPFYLKDFLVGKKKKSP